MFNLPLYIIEISSTKIEIKRFLVLNLELLVFGMFFFPYGYVVSFNLGENAFKKKSSNQFQNISFQLGQLLTVELL